MEFKIGDKIVCITDTYYHIEQGEEVTVYKQDCYTPEIIEVLSTDGSLYYVYAYEFILVGKKGILYHGV